MIEILADNPLLLFFVVAAAGFLIGRVRIAGLSIGVAAVLFVGLGVGALSPRLRLPDFAYLLGLVLFVYTVGLASGPGVVGSLRQRGLRLNLLAAAALAAGAALVALGAYLAGIGAPRAAGLFAGSLTNTPALAAVLETLQGPHASGGTSAGVSAEPVVGYALAYPGGVLGLLLAMILARQVFGLGEDDAVVALPTSATAKVGRPELDGLSLAQVRSEGGLDVAFARLRHGGDEVHVASDDTVVAKGDLVSVVGTSDAVEKAVQFFGGRSSTDLAEDRHATDFRRLFVSSADVTQRSIASIALPERFGAVVTRVRRGDVDLVARPDLVLQLGDRVRVVAPRERFGDIARFFGDSYRALSDVDIVSFGLGIALGLLLGEVPIPLPGGASLRLGYAGGPLVVALLLGSLGRTGPLVWTLPYGANQTLRQLGVVLFLAGVGTRSGHAFVSTLREGGALPALAIGALTTFTVASTVLVVGRVVLGVSLRTLMGVVAGVHTQPAALAFAGEMVGEDRANEGYATVFPLATLAKIVLAQLFLAVR
jgi:putative transport protein